ncbi:MAG: amidohydrolase family protein [Actinobacteria bacterium]|nr:amidohydrolase family protein [Actinomycetota bacterium]
MIERGRVVFAGAAADLGVVASHEDGVESLSGRPIPPEADEEILVDGFLLPGVVDRHVHIALAAPAAVLAGGVTAVRDLGWPPEDVLPLAQASESPSFDGPLIRAVGPMITCRGGYPTGSGWAPPGTGLEVSGAEEAATAAERTLDESGTGVVKVALNAEAGPTLRDDELVAVCDAAHARRAIVTAHAQGAGQVERALGAGVDELAHAPWSEELSDDLLQSLARSMRIVSTLDIHSYGRDTPELRIATDNVRRFLAAGGTVAYGTDLGNGPIPVGIHPGEAWHLHRSGMSVEEVLRAMTFRPLAPGEPGDVVALGGNPMHDLTALGDVRLVLREGRRTS